jgi:hypothetical protein
MDILSPRNGKNIKWDVTKGNPNYLQVIISRRPGLMVRFSLPVFFIIFIVILGTTWAIQYPEMVQSEAVIMDAYDPSGPLCAEVTLHKRYLKKMRSKVSVQFLFKTGPFRKMGFLSGRLVHVSHQDARDSFRVRIVLPEIVAHHEVIEKEDRMKFDVLIKIEDKRLLQRIFTAAIK